jgi:hypothetical protein
MGRTGRVAALDAAVRSVWLTGRVLMPVYVAPDRLSPRHGRA